MIITRQVGHKIRNLEHEVITLPRACHYHRGFQCGVDGALHISESHVHFSEDNYQHCGDTNMEVRQDLDPKERSESWGCIPPTDQLSHQGIRNILYNFLTGELLWGHYDAINLLKRYQVGISTEDPGQLAIWPDRVHYNQGLKKRRRGKPGRMLRHVIPNLTDQEVEKMVNEIRDEYMIDVSTYTHKVGTEKSDFKHAYTHMPAQTAQVDTTNDRKLSVDSCMRYDFNHLSHHPVEAYASGDFEIHWLEDSQNRIAARSVVHLESATRGPVYGVSEPAIDKLISLLPPRSYGDEWKGARILRLPVDDYTIIAPYLDVDIDGYEDTADYKFLKMTYRESTWTTNGHEGTQTQGEMESCAHCSCDFPQSELEYVDGYGEICPGCLENDFTRCDHSNDLVSEDSLDDVHTSSGVEQWCYRSRTHYATYIHRLDQLWADGDIRHDYEGEPFTVEELLDGEWVLHTDGDYYPADHKIFEEEEEKADA